MKTTKYINYEFESSSIKTPEFKQFARDFKSDLQKLLGGNKDYKIVAYNVGHFYVSGFIKNEQTEKLAYFSISDVRFFSNAWFNDILIRTAKDIKDYTGGSNHSTKLVDIYDNLNYLLN